MPDAFPTLLTIALANGSDAVAGLIDETARNVPEISGQVMYRGKAVSVPNVGAARTIAGMQYKTLIRTALPVVAFRNANEGSLAVKGTYENRMVETYIMNPRWNCDVAIADRYEDGAEAFIALEAQAIVAAAMQALGQQFYYGRTGADSKGFPGLNDSVDASMIIDATGSTASTGSSVWAVKFGPQNVQWVFGNGGSLDMQDPRKESVLDGSNASFTAYVQELLAYPGVQVLDKFSVGKIKNLTAQTGKGLTDSLLDDLVSAFPVGRPPDAIFATKRSLSQLRKSRTATNATGAEAPTPQGYRRALEECNKYRDFSLAA
ncbi:MAG: hypothetical protein QM811_16820 [Pirellulales bacterium]